MSQELVIEAKRIVSFPLSDGSDKHRIVAFGYTEASFEAARKAEAKGEAVFIILREPDNAEHVSNSKKVIFDVSIPNRYPRHSFGPTDVMFIDSYNA
jgi:hypothetical protein